MKFGAGHPFADPEAAARKRSPAASSPINGPFLCDASGTGSGFRMGRTFASNAIGSSGMRPERM